MFDFLNRKALSDLAYVLDFLLRVALDGEKIKEVRHVDLEFYNLLNRPAINQEIFHVGALPLTRGTGKLSNDFVSFLHKLAQYIEYDVNSDFVWAQVADDQAAQSQVEKRALHLKRELLAYLLTRDVIASDDFAVLADKGVKSLMQ